MPSQSTLGRKTKQDVLEEYEKLKEQFDELKMTAKFVNSSETQGTIDILRGQTKENINKSISDFKRTSAAEMSEATGKMNAALDDLLVKALDEIEKFNELQKAIEASKKNLSLHYNIQVVAETLENLVVEYENKKKRFEDESQAAKEIFSADVAAKKRDWEREQEEYAYNLKLQRRKESDLYEEEREKQQKESEARESALSVREDEMKKLQAEAADFPKQLEKELAAKEKEVGAALGAEFKNKMELAQKDWTAEKRFYELRKENLENQIKKQDAELSLLKKEAEAANKKAQELAVKVIERGNGTGSSSKIAEEKE